MSKPFYMTDEMRENLVKKINKKLKEAMLYDRDITVKPEWKKIQASVDLVFEPKAFLKMQTLIMCNEWEVAWNGVVEKVDKTKFLVKDIVVYPQVVYPAYCESDDERYAKWFITLDEYTANHLHLHGHSHVDMSVTPSGEDIKSQLETLKQLGKSGFFIFMIANKRNQRFFKIVDLDENMVYDTNDVIVSIEGDDFSSFDWINTTLENVRRSDKQTSVWDEDVKEETYGSF